MNPQAISVVSQKEKVTRGFPSDSVENAALKTFENAVRGLLKNGQRVHNGFRTNLSIRCHEEHAMNDKFYSLPEKKQQKIIQAGFLVFSRNSYKKSPMQEIADRAGISKSLLFHYFANKRELYLFLWDNACLTTVKYLDEYGCYEPDDLFEMMERGMKAKLHMMKQYPTMTSFVIRAFYEKDPAVSASIQESYRMYFGIKATDALSRIDLHDFVPGLDLSMMYREMYLSSVGYLWEIFQRDAELDTVKLEQDFEQMLSFWKQSYLRHPPSESV